MKSGDAASYTRREVLRLGAAGTLTAALFSVGEVNTALAAGRKSNAAMPGSSAISVGFWSGEQGGSLVPAEQLSAGSGSIAGADIQVHLVSSGGLDNVDHVGAASIDFVLDQDADIRYHAWHLQNFGAVSVSSPVAFRLPAAEQSGLQLVTTLAGPASTEAQTNNVLSLISGAGDGQIELVTGYYVLALQESPGSLPVRWFEYRAGWDASGDVVVSHHSAPATGFMYVVFRFEPAT